MSGRNKLPRRTPHSSSGNIAFSIASQDIPQAQPSARSAEYTNQNARSSNASLPSLGGTSASTKASPQERIVRNLVNKLNSKLPYYSGLRLSEMEDNEAVTQIITALVQLSKRSINVIIWTVCEILDRLSKKTISGEYPIDVLESEIFLVRIIKILLTSHWNVSMEERYGGSNGPEEEDGEFHARQFKITESLRLPSEGCLTDPPALEDNIANYCLATMKAFLRRSGFVKVDDVRPDGRLGSFDSLREAVLFEMDSMALQAAHHWPSTDLGKGLGYSVLAYSPPPSNRSVTSFASASVSGKTTVAAYVPSALAVRATKISTLEGLVTLTQLAGAVVHRLSATNWSIVFSRVRNKLHQLASTQAGDDTDILDLRLITYSLIDKTRLIQILQEISTLSLSMRFDSQAALTVILRSVVWNWIQDFTDEFVDVLRSPRRRLEGWPERVYDLFQARVDASSRPFFWPTLSILLAISPDRMRNAEAALSGTLTYGKKHNNFLEQLHSTLGTQVKLGETVIQCYNDLCGAAWHVPPTNMGDNVLRMLAPDLADELKARLVNPPPPAKPLYEIFEPIDINLYTEAILNVMRYHPYSVLHSVLTDCLDPIRSAAVNLCAVRALTIYITEATKFPWQKPLDQTLYDSVAPKLRTIRSQLTDGTMDSRGNVRPQGMRDGVVIDDKAELLTHLQALWRLDAGLLLCGIQVQGEVQFLDNITNFFQWHNDATLQVSTFRTFGALLARLYNPEDEHYDTVQSLMTSSVPQTLQLIATQLMRVTDNMEATKRCVSLILGILTQLSDKTMEGRQEWKYGEERTTALAAVELALCLSLTAPRLDVCSLASRAFRLLAFAEQDPNAPLPKHCSKEQAKIRWQIFETVGDPKFIVLGRVEFQKRIRMTLAQSVFPCIMHLAVWREMYQRWLGLTPLVIGSAPRLSVDQASSYDGSSFSGLDREQQKFAWDNMTLMLAATANTCASDDPALNASDQYGITQFYPGISDRKPSQLVEEFLSEVVKLLDTPWIPGQILCRDALGLELPPKWIPKLFHILDERLRYVNTSSNGDLNGSQPSRIVLADQIISVLKSLIDRMGEDSGHLRSDFGEILTLLAQLTKDAPQRAHEYRIKTRFCAVLDLVLEKRAMFYIREENTLRNRLLDSVSDWILESSSDHPDEDMNRGELMRSQAESNMAALKTAVKLCEDLRLKLPDDPNPPDGMSRVVSRLFHRYLNIFLGMLTPFDNMSSNQEYDYASQTETINSKHEGQIVDLVVTGISNMLQANTEAGTKHVLALAYDSSERTRVIFAHVLCRVLNKGTKFERSTEDVSSPTPKNILCDTLQNSEDVARAVIDACPMAEVDTIVPVLLNVFNTRRSLLSLLKMVVKRQVQLMDNATDVFRFNDLCSRLFSAFARSHGYGYLRRIIQPLIKTMTDFPEDACYELDPSKIPHNQKAEDNAANLERITGAFLQVIVDSLSGLPTIIREVCRYIDEAVSARWKDGRQVVASFLFLRFIVPAVVSPESIDVDVSRGSPEGTAAMRRGLLLVAKVIQSLANNVLFGKEVHMTVLNKFLRLGIHRIGRFYLELLKRSPDEPTENPDENLGNTYDEADAIILYHFFQRHSAKIGQALLASGDSKQVWEDICTFLVDTRPSMEFAVLSNNTMASHQLFRQFMLKHNHRNVESVSHLFVQAMERSPTFVFSLCKVNVDTVDFDLLMYHALKLMKDYCAWQQTFDLVVDCTDFSATSEIPISWYKKFLEHLPLDVRQHLETVYILNPNSAALKFFRKLYWAPTDSHFAKKFVSVTSVIELQTLGIHPASLAPMAYATDLEGQDSHSYQCRSHVRDQLWTSVVLSVSASHLRIITVKDQSPYPELAFRTVEIIPIPDIADIILLPASEGEAAEYFLIRRVTNRPAIRLSSLQRDSITEMIQKMKDRKPPQEIAPVKLSHRSDVVASLLNFGLFNICDNHETLRSAAFSLLYAVCSYLGYDSNTLAAFQGPFIPPNIATSIIPFNERLAKSLPHLTLDLINDFAIAFEKVTPPQMLSCLQYLHPWIKNLPLFANPSSSLYDNSTQQLNHTIEQLVNMTLKYPDVLQTAQKYIWIEIARNDGQLLTATLNELVRTATVGGGESQRCEQVADILISMSSINVRAYVVKALRKVLHKTTGKQTKSLIHSNSWNEISTLTRLTLAAIYSSRLAIYNQLYVPEVAHIITLLCATGTTHMRLTVYSIAINLVQSLQVVRADNEASVTALQNLLDKASGEELLGKFGLSRAYGTSEYISTDPSADQISIPALEGVTEFLIEVLTHGSGGMGMLNVWRARWMSLVSSTAFQICPYVQYRAFVVMGLLASSGMLEMDDDIFYQILVSLKTALISSVEQDSTAIMSILRCISRVVPGLSSESRYLAQIFWVSVALLQSTYIPIYEEAARLLEVTLERMHSLGLFTGQRLSAVLLDARTPLSHYTKQLDDLVNLSFDTNFSLSLASIVFRGIRTPSFMPVMCKTLRTLLRIGSHTMDTQSGATTNGTPSTLDEDVLGYFLALLPFSSTPSSYQELLQNAGVSTKWLSTAGSDQSSEEVESMPMVNTDLLGLDPEDHDTALLVISFLFAMLDGFQGTEHQKAFIFNLLAQLAPGFPDIAAAAVVHALAISKSDWLLNSLSENPIGPAESTVSVQSLFNIAMANPAWDLISSGAGMATEEGLAALSTPHSQALAEVKMRALAVPLQQSLSRGEAWKILKWIPEILNVLDETNDPDS
ncbi:hypothetical protein M422DRAFT_219023 [Sphaerobolus stellatus SS14]|nr:hypothetical protein M422DRAFT_219023 [Sphaerobolus stellatus SS14]